jgi:thioredoxin 1
MGGFSIISVIVLVLIITSQFSKMATKLLILLNLLTTVLAFRSISTFTTGRKHHILKSSSQMVELKDSNYKQVLLENKAVLVDVFATCCGPCKLIQPILEKAAAKWSEQISIVKYNIEGSDNSDVKQELILQMVMPRSLPSLILFQDGKAIATRNGALTEEQLDDFLASQLFSHSRPGALEDHDSVLSSM